VRSADENVTRLSWHTANTVS